MHKVILHIGSNVGNKLKYLAVCKRLIKEKIGRVVKSSSIFETEAWGLKNQDSFLNQAFEVSTNLGPESILEICQEIEALLSRERSVRWGPRTIDIDIIFYDNLIIEDDLLSIPHPRMHERNFVLIPLNEIAPQWEHPILNKSVHQLLEESQDKSHVSI
jgi:2-amino-4-hydroxy-6-hydroxymethyldihydropteridine diphosphokinase